MIEILVGFFSGIVASMGLGGGFILIIYLTVIANTEQAAAQGINILFFLPIAVISIIMHAKNKLIEWKIVLKFALTGLVGVVIGTFIGRSLDSAILSKLFAALLVFVGLRELFHKSKKTNKKRTGNE